MAQRDRSGIPPGVRGVSVRHRACAALIRDGKILMVRHVHDGKNYWTLPGGGIEPGESAAQAAEREVKEETGLDTRVVRLLWERPWNPDGSQERCLLVDPVDTNQEASAGADPEEAHLPADSRMLKEARWWPLTEMKSDVQVSKVLQALSTVEGSFGDDLVREQMAYYDARAPEYDEWWERRGRYDLGTERNAAVRVETAEVTGMLDELPFNGELLEFAGGTGIWTSYLARRAKRVHVLDGSEPMLALNTSRMTAEGCIDRVTYERVDVFGWKPAGQFDGAFAGFWVSHIPADRLDDFFRKASASLRPGGTFAILEGLPARARSVHQGTARVDNDLEIRTLNDGSTFRVVKREMHADELVPRLERAGFSARARQTASHFILLIGAKAG